MRFTHLHVHSHYSLLDGLSKIDNLLNYTKELGMDSIALTDHGVLYGAVEFYKKAKEKGIKPIIGCEMYVANERMEDKRPNIDNKRYHLILLVKNEKGYQNLVKLVTAAHLKGFYYKPRIDNEILEKHSEGLICLTACIQGRIPRLILSKKIKEAEDLALKYKKLFGKDNFYLELQDHPNIKEQKKVNDILISLSKKLDIPLVATNDSHYLRKEDAEAQDILMMINTGADINDPERMTMKIDDFSLKSPEEMIKAFKETPEAIENTQKIKEACNFDFELGKTKLPYFEVPKGSDPDKFLKKLCEERIKNKYPKLNQEVKERLEYELSMIKQVGFASYFLIVQDFVNWAKENRIVVGPGRGSAAGSIVSYILNITNVDPLKYNLLFERFLNPERIAGLPDIDLDFTDRRRDEVIHYVAEKYGKDKVAQIITFGTMAARMVIRDVGRVLNYPYSYCDKIAKMIPLGFNLDKTISEISEFRQLYHSDLKAKKLIDLGKKLEGVARHASTHACGVVISKDSLTETVPLQHPTQNGGTIITQYEMHAIEDLGHLKMDFLGLKNLTVIEDTLKMIYAIHHKSIDIEKIPVDDKKTYKLLQKGETVGIFQLESEGIQRYLKRLKPNSFEDIIAMVALYRPGPIKFIPTYIKRKLGKEKVRYIHPKLKSILEPTQGICIYQEQLMKIAQELAGFSLGEADILRKAVGKKIKTLLISQQKKLLAGMEKNGIEKEVAQKIWQWVIPFARYGFNRSHSACYSLIAYQTAYLKTHHPLEFMACLLTSERNDLDRISVLIEECEKMGIEVLPPDINESFRNFSVVPESKINAKKEISKIISKRNLIGEIRFGLLAVKNVGSNIVENIVKERKENGKFKSIEGFISRVSCKDLNKKSMESLTKAGAFDKLEERNKLLFNMERILEKSRENQKMKINGQKGLFEKTSFESKMRLKETELASKTEKLKWEKELLGLYVSGHPLDRYQKAFKNSHLHSVGKLKISPIEEIKEEDSRERFKKVRIGVIISNLKKFITKTGKPMFFLKVEDLTGKIEVIVFPSIVEKSYSTLKVNKIILVSGKVDWKDNSPKILAEGIEEVIEE